MKMLSILDIANCEIDKSPMSRVEDLLKASDSYKDNSKKFTEISKGLDRKTFMKLDELSVSMEVEAIETAFTEGFNTAVRLIMGCMGGAFNG